MSGRKKKKALGVRVRRVIDEIADQRNRMLDKVPLWKRRDGVSYYYFPCDMFAYFQRYHPKAWAFIRDVVVPVLVSIPASLLGVKLALWYFTTHISGGG